MADLLHVDMFKVLSDVLRTEAVLIQRGKSGKFGYLPMMAVATLGALNAESFCERVLSSDAAQDRTCTARAVVRSGHRTTARAVKKN
jgi:hypothetical protein